MACDNAKEVGKVILEKIGINIESNFKETQIRLKGADNQGITLHTFGKKPSSQTHSSESTSSSHSHSLSGSAFDAMTQNTHSLINRNEMPNHSRLEEMWNAGINGMGWQMPDLHLPGEMVLSENARGKQEERLPPPPITSHRVPAFLPLFNNQESHSPTFNLAAPFSHADLQAARFAAAQSGSHSLSDIQSVPVNRSMGEIMLDLILPRAEASPVLIPVAAEIAAEIVTAAAGKAGAFVAGALGVGTLAAVAAPHLRNMAENARESVERGGFLIHSEEPRPYLGPRPEDRHKQPPLTFVNENRNEDPLVFPAHSSQNSEGKYVSPIMALPGVFIMYKKQGGQGKNERPYAPDPDKRYHKIPKFLPAFPDAVIVKGKTYDINGKERKRWKLPEGILLEWDRQHGCLEKYTRRGVHLGEFDPNTGNQVKEPIKGRKIEP